MSIRNSLMAVSLLLSVTIGLVISNSGSGTQRSQDKKIIIGFSMDTLKEARWQKDRDIFERQVKKLGASVLVQAANSDDTQQMRDVEALISRDVDVLVIVPHNGKAMAKAVALAHEADIPVISYDRLIKDAPVDLYISFDNVKVGEMQAQYLLKRLPGGKGKIIRIYGSKTDNNAFLFKQGQDNILQPHIDSGDIEVIHEDWAEEWKPENGKKIANAAITKYGNAFDAILAANDGTAGGAIQALKEEGLAGQKIVIGQDAELVACQRIAVGTQTMTIYKPIANLAEKAAEIAVQVCKNNILVVRETVFNGTHDVPSLLLDVQAVTKENMMDTIIKDGFHSYDDIYRDVPAEKRPQK